MIALQQFQQQERSLDSYVILPESSRRGQEYPALLVSQDKDHFSKNWYQAHRSLAKEGSFMLNPRQFFDFVLALDSGKRIYNGNGKLVDSSVKSILSQKGVHGIVVERYEAPSVHEFLHQAEKRMIIRRSS